MLLIGGSYADTANNSFASVSGNGVVADGESGFCIKNVEGTVEITVNERPGWKCEKGAPYGYAHNEGDVDNIRFDGLDDEETATISISNVWECVHETTNIDYHVSSPGAEDKGPFHMIAAYSSPASKGAALSFDRSIVLEGRVGHHTNIVIALRCPNPKCDYGIKNPIEESDIVVDPSPVVASADMPEGGILQADGRIVYPQGTHKVCYKADFSNDCEKCGFHKEVLRTIDVYKATSTADEYVGLDRTDAGYAKEHTMSGSVTLKAIPPHVAFNWNVWPHCKIKDNNDGESVVCIVKRIAGDVPGGKDFEYSSRYRQERLSCGINIWDDCTPNCKADTSTTNNFTVVKVDVVIDDLSESLEEEEGAFTYYVPDGDAPIWAEEWTNSLKNVSITCEPHDGEMAKQTVKLTFDDEFLWVEKGDGTVEKAKHSYTIEELNKTKFKLHGHKKSAKYKDKEIVAIHEKSLAIDKAKFTVFGRPWLVPDYDRKNGIDDDDIAKAKEGKTIFRFWVNDDDDRNGLILQPDGRILDWQLHKSMVNGNCENSVVDGFSDLVDLTPLWLDISDVFPEENEELKNSVEWHLESDCYNAVWTFQVRGKAHLFRDQRLTTCGPEFNASLHEAPVCKLSGEGAVIPAPLISQMMAANGSAESRGVVMLEGCKAGERLELIGKSKNTGRKIASGILRTKVSPVSDMIRWMNLRGVVSKELDTGERSNYEAEPRNRPDSECLKYDRRHFIFVHGYNINKNEAFGWACEVFKRLWQSGYRGRYTGVDWYGDDTQIDLGITTFCPNYWGNVVHAFDTAPALKRGVDQLDGEKVVMAHSLGNMLVCSAIADEGMTNGISRYYMLNAAVPIQALAQEEYYNSVMIPNAWSKVDHEFMSAHWHELFQANDFRSKLNWVARFKGLPGAVKTVSLYSLTENVVRDNAAKPAWKLQEMWKGGIVSSFFGCEVGWSQNDYHSRFWEDLFSFEENAMVARSLRLTSEQKITEPLFSKFKTRGKELHNLERYYFPAAQEQEEKHLRAQILGCCIPATSLCVGANEMPKNTAIKSYEYSGFKSGSMTWPRKGDEWHHSDFVVVAYYYITLLYDKLQEGL